LRMDIEKARDPAAEIAKTNSWPNPTKLELDNDITGSQSDAPANSSNPQFWTKWKKRRLMVVLCVASLLTDWGITWGTPLFAAQAVGWNMTPSAVGSSLSGGVFLQGAGGLFAVPLTQRYGRYVLVLGMQNLIQYMCILEANFKNTQRAKEKGNSRDEREWRYCIHD
jgi:hypothetical protein